MTDARAQHKADSFVRGWQKRYGVTPSKHTVLLGLCMPSAETDCGDAWRGPDGILGTQDDTRNWGATTVEVLGAAALAMLKAAGIFPTVGAGHVERAKQAQAALEAAGFGFEAKTKRGVLVPRAEIHCDSKPNDDGSSTPYFVWFAAFDLDTEGLETDSVSYFLSFIAEPGNPGRVVLDDPRGNVYQLAAAAYARGYFAGFKPHRDYMTAGPDKIMGTADDVLHHGDQENIDAYGAWLAPHFAKWTWLLTDWQPSEPPPDFVFAQPIPLDVDWDALEAERDAAIAEKDFG